MGKVKPIPVFIQPNGIASVKDSLQYMKDGKASPTDIYELIGQIRIDAILTFTVNLQVSAQKPTYRISDTPAV
jgi:hypothetical protein